MKRRTKLTNTRAKTFKLADLHMPLIEYPSSGIADFHVLSAPYFSECSLSGLGAVLDNILTWIRVFRTGHVYLHRWFFHLSCPGNLHVILPWKLLLPIPNLSSSYVSLHDVVTAFSANQDVFITCGWAECIICFYQNSISGALLPIKYDNSMEYNILYRSNCCQRCCILSWQSHTTLRHFR